MKNIKISKILKKQGKAKNKSDSDFDPNELKKGIRIEYEHIDKKEYSAAEAKEIAKEIAKDHLEEFPDYYTRLIKMEKKAEKENFKENFTLKQFLKMYENENENEDEDEDEEKNKILPKDIEKKVIAFLKKNPNPNDDKVHFFAKKIGIDPDKLEPVFYKLATKAVK